MYSKSWSGSHCPERGYRQGIDFAAVTAFFATETICCFTSDLDWAPEWAIRAMLDTFAELDVPLMPFITHPSAAIQQQYGRGDKARYVGLHPNFLPGSSHGTSYEEQIAFCQRLWPEARAFRAHAFFDNALVTKEMVARGFRYDSNVCLFLHPYCTPLRHESGLVRFPVFWEDDVHAKWGLPFRLEGDLKRALSLSGLKVFNFHPLNLAINAPNDAYYQQHKFLYREGEIENWRDHAFDGRGEQTFLKELVSFLRDRGVPFVYLDDLYRSLAELGGVG